MPARISSSPDLVVEKQSAKTSPPPMYRVILLNDDYTPMEFVVHVLQKFFGKGHEEAMRIMLQVHARARQHPLQCVMEPASDN